jgi:predicted nucleic acid-binding protein
MIVPDASVWIDFLNKRSTPQTVLLREAISAREVLVGDVILTEVLQGVRDDNRFKHDKAFMLSFLCWSFVGQNSAIQAAENFRFLRKRGITVRKTIDVIIATFCITHDLPLLHNDRDFDAMEQYLGLRILR